MWIELCNFAYTYTSIYAYSPVQLKNEEKKKIIKIIFKYFDKSGHNIVSRSINHGTSWYMLKVKIWCSTDIPCSTICLSLNLILQTEVVCLALWIFSLCFSIKRKVWSFQSKRLKWNIQQQVVSNQIKKITFISILIVHIWFAIHKCCFLQGVPRNMTVGESFKMSSSIIT